MTWSNSWWHLRETHVFCDSWFHLPATRTARKVKAVVFTQTRSINVTDRPDCEIQPVVIKAVPALYIQNLFYLKNSDHWKPTLLFWHIFCECQLFNLDKFSWKQLCSSNLDKRSREAGATSNNGSKSGPLLPAGGPPLSAPFVVRYPNLSCFTFTLSYHCPCWNPVRTCKRVLWKVVREDDGRQKFTAMTRTRLRAGSVLKFLSEEGSSYLLFNPALSWLKWISTNKLDNMRSSSITKLVDYSADILEKCVASTKTCNQIGRFD
jgi:hypothetical protein